MALRAVQPIHRGLLPAVQPGEIVPDTYTDLQGREHPYDMQRLLDLGVAEKTVLPRKAKADD